MTESTDELLTPEEHAEATGNTKRLRFQRAVGGTTPSGAVLSAAHMGAAALHGWELHKTATTEPLRITRDAYLAALEAANSGGAPHDEALSEFTPKLTATPEAKPVPARRKLRR